MSTLHCQDCYCHPDWPNHLCWKHRIAKAAADRALKDYKKTFEDLKDHDAQ